ncbi:hypothetical protein Afil01_23080 [Actinorhabdospora filicis]|uniref:Uncharacterized protein n=1 Tax=Actinorhabdospora filicis TaxID=1785913 RepID=A0A9W6SMV7_9ACTN|nr:hypothetical protein Afil01_23080 [Actinorhabdospora filicis]
MTLDQVYAEYVKLRQACHDSYIAVTERIRGAVTPPPDVLARSIQIDIQNIDAAFEPMLSIIGADYVQPTYDGMNALKKRLDDDDFASAALAVGEVVGDWRGSAANNFHVKFIGQFKTAVGNQRKVANAVVDAYAGVMNLSNAVLGAGLAIAKSGQEAYKAAGEGGGTYGPSGVKLLLNIINMVTGVGAAVAGAATGGATIALWLGSTSAVSGFFGNVIEDAKNNPPLITGSHPATVTANIVKKLGESLKAHKEREDKWKEKIQGDLDTIRGNLESQLLPQRPAMVGGPAH